jgi:hypothetical protein
MARKVREDRTPLIRSEPSWKNQALTDSGAEMSVLLMIAFFVAWFALQTWILPKFGVPT